jgi:hypothetical protein
MFKEQIAFHLKESVDAQARALIAKRHTDTLNAIAALGLALAQLTQAVIILAAALPPAQSLPHARDAPDTHQH